MKEEIKVTNQRYRLGYHLMTKGGWMNDPNGFSWFKGYYHIFYQCYPYDVEWGPMHWGHARSKDLIHWETLPIALTPGDQEDGCFSGSAVVYEDKLWLVYTGHHYLDSEDTENFYETQNLAWSEDGVNFVKYDGNPILSAPKDNTKHFRDPKVWQEEGSFYMVLGSQATDGLGRALLYQSENLKDWKLIGVLDKAEALREEGFMWECPDFFHLDGKDVLLMSPQGIEPQGDCYRNLSQTGYFLGRQDENRVLLRDKFFEIDKGHDFYATQTMETPDGRRIMTAWMNAWDSPMCEKEDGWAGALIIPRELRVQGNHLYQRPIREMESIREKKLYDEGLSGKSRTGIPRQAEIQLNFKSVAENADLFQIDDGEQKLSLSKFGRRIVLRCTSKDEERAAEVHASEALDFWIFVDQSSVEIFVNDGELTFTERVYWNNRLYLQMLEQGADGARIYSLEKETNKY